MKRYLARRLLVTVAVIFATTIMVFGALELVPGDPAQLMLGEDATPQKVAELHQKLGLDLPMWKQYTNFLAGIAHGDLGLSYLQNRPVSGELARTFPVTLQLSIVAMIISVFLGVGIGILTAVRVDSWVDNLLRVLLLASASIPIYWLGLLMIYLFAVKWPLLPAVGWGSFKQLILPSLTLATFPLALFGRLSRATMLDVLNQDFVRTARAKGLPERVVVFRHALRGALVPVVTIVGLQLGTLMAGAVLTESVFAVPGLGQLLINAVFARDYAIIRGCVLLAAMVVAVMNLVVDLMYLVLDPRIRYQ